MRCFGDESEQMAEYHDTEWGVELHGEAALLERMVLEGFQSGLSWATVLRKREAFREVFHGFDPELVAAMTPADVERLLKDERIIRNRAKIEATINNAQTVLELHKNGQTLNEIVWSFAPPPRPAPLATAAEIPSTSPESIAMSKALKKLGFRFFGPTTAYAMMQAVGMVDDHPATCDTVAWRLPYLSA